MAARPRSPSITPPEHSFKDPATVPSLKYQIQETYTDTDDAVAEGERERLRSPAALDDESSDRSNQNPVQIPSNASGYHALLNSPPRKESIDHPSKRQDRRGLLPTYDRVTNDFWTYEVTALLVSTAALVSIFAVLLAFQNGPTPHIMRGVSLNTAISILATVSRAAIVFVAASVIAQQKWLRFENGSRSLYDVSLYDDASRGPLGSLYLLGSLRLSLVTSLAAIVAVLSLGFEPFVQQSVRFPLRDTPLSSRQPTLPAVQNMTFPDANLTTVLDPIILQALYAKSVTPLQPFCVGTNCNWPTYGSAAFCSVCEDAMDDVVIEPGEDAALAAFLSDDFLSSVRYQDVDLDGTFPTLSKTINTSYTVSLGAGTAPGNFMMNFRAEARLTDLGISRELTYPDTIVWNMNHRPGGCYMDLVYHVEPIDCFPWSNRTINSVRGPLIAFGFVKTARSPDGLRLTAASAQRCVISLCAQQYSTTIHNGSLSSNVTHTEFGHLEYHSFYASYYGAMQWSAAFGKTTYACRSPDTFHPIFPGLYNALARVQGMVQKTHRLPASTYASTNINAAADVMQFMRDIRNSSAKIAQGLTNFIQQNADHHIQGQAYTLTPYVEVRWVWLTFPLALVLVGILALLITTIQTRWKRMAVWRSSPFPLLFNYQDHEFDDPTRGVFVPKAVKTSRHLAIAKDTRLRLKSAGGIWTFEKEKQA